MKEGDIVRIKGDVYPFPTYVLFRIYISGNCLLVSNDSIPNQSYQYLWHNGFIHIDKLDYELSYYREQILNNLFDNDMVIN